MMKNTVDPMAVQAGVFAALWQNADTQEPKPSLKAKKVLWIASLVIIQKKKSRTAQHERKRRSFRMEMEY
jgi:hypothetical protein